MAEKDLAFEFLSALEQHIRRALPDVPAMVQEISRTVDVSRASVDARHMASPESAFLNRFVAPAIHSFLSQQAGMNAESARQALLSESYRRIPKLASGTPAGYQPHPFSKLVGAKPREIVEQWKLEKGELAVSYSCYPDLAIRPPAPHKIVFEAKYFSRGGRQAAETAIVTGIYQAFFYRALPRMPKTNRHAAWDYDYACLLAYDATLDGTLLQAWDSLNPALRKSCWQGANVSVMILRGSG